MPMKLSYSILVFITIGVFIVSYFTPLHGDDFNYSFICSPEEMRDVSPFWNYFDFYTDNFAGVGRFIPHLIVAFFTDFTGKGIFNIFSTIGYILLCYIISTIASNNQSTRVFLTIIAATLIWLIIPGFFEAFLWMAGACNYLFIAIILLLFYRFLTSESNPSLKWYQIPLWFVLGFITGWSNEGFIIGLSGATGIYYLFIHPRELKHRRIFMLAGLWLGTICLCLTPFNLYRFLSGHSGQTGVIQIVSNVANAILNLTDIRISFLLAFVLIMAIALKLVTKDRIGTFLRKNLILIMAWVISLVFVIITGFTNGNSRTPAEIFALTILMSFIANILTKRCLHYTAIASGCTMLITLAFIIPECINNFHNHENMAQQIKAQKDLIIVDNTKGNSFSSRYYYPVLQSMYRAPIPMAKFPVAYYGGKPEALVLSTSICDMLKNWTPDTKFMLDDDIGSIWIKNTGNPDPEKVVLHIRPMANSEMNIFERFIAPYFDRYSMTRYECTEFVSEDILGDHWIVIGNYPLISARVFDVELK